MEELSAQDILDGNPGGQAMGPLDLRFLVRELRAGLIGGIIGRAYQYGKSGAKQLLLEVSGPGRPPRLLYWDGGRAFLTESKRPMPVEPPNFCMFLRKHLLGQEILDIRQYKFSQVLEMAFRDYVLILEFMPPGNAILCDSSYRIIMPLEIQKWRGRVVKPKEAYRYPRAGDNPLDMGLDGFQRLLGSSEKGLGAVLADNLGFGPVYSRELCRRAGLDTRASASGTGFSQVLKLHNTMESVLGMGASPAVYKDMVSPFPLSFRDDRPLKTLQSFSRALDEFFSGQPLLMEERKPPAEKTPLQEAQSRPPETEGPQAAREAPAPREEDAPDGYYHQGKYAGKPDSSHELKKQAGEPAREEEAQVSRGGGPLWEKWERIARDSGEKAGLIQRNRSLVESVLGGINGARESGLSWDEVKQKVMGEQTPEAEAVREIREGDALVVLDLGGRDVELDFRLGAGENASRYQDDMEWARGKLSQAGGHAPESRPEGMAAETPGAPEKPRRRRKKWFEKFHWFLSSDGFLVIGGRDARQNQMIMDKRMGPGDLVFHADIPGAPLVVINSGDREISGEAKKEAAELAAAVSRAWTRGPGNADVFCVKPDQVSREPAHGEYLPKGSFMITGEREWFRETELKLSIGVKIEREMGEARAVSGPVMPVRTHSDYFVTIRPGYKKSLELAREIRNNILIKASPEDKFLIDRVPLEDIQRLIPSGSGDIVDFGA